MVGNALSITFSAKTTGLPFVAKISALSTPAVFRAGDAHEHSHSEYELMRIALREEATYFRLSKILFPYDFYL